MDHRDYCREALVDEDRNELVVPGSACSRCGERRMDCLAFDAEAEFVTCATCGHTYLPGSGDTPQTASAPQLS